MPIYVGRALITKSQEFRLLADDPDDLYSVVSDAMLEEGEELVNIHVDYIARQPNPPTPERRNDG